MSYTPTEWKNGDTITAEKLNKIEEGIADGGVLIVTKTDDVEHTQITLSKTWQEIYDAVISGKQILLDNSDSGNISLNFLTDIYTINDSGQYNVHFSTVDEYYAYSADSYPAYYYGE